MTTRLRKAGTFWSRLVKAFETVTMLMMVTAILGLITIYVYDRLSAPPIGEATARRYFAPVTRRC